MYRGILLRALAEYYLLEILSVVKEIYNYREAINYNNYKECWAAPCMYYSFTTESISSK